MRTIEFRGKRIDDGEWIYGYLADVQEQYGYATINYVFDDGEEHWESCDLVDVNTVGQYTVLHDCNGKEIYEKSELDGKYRVEYIPPKFVGRDLTNNEIIDLYENRFTITKEYI